MGNEEANIQGKPLPSGMIRMPDNKVRFQKGNNLGGRRKGVLNKNTQLKQSLSLHGWKELKDYVETHGISRFIAEMERLEGKDYIIAFLGILPYVKPKIANISYYQDEPGSKGRIEAQHTITIKDMRDGTMYSIEA